MNDSDMPMCFRAVVQHAHFRKTLDELLELAEDPGSKSMALVIGVTGSGKTTLKRVFLEHLEKSCHEEIAQDLEFIPYASASIKAPGPIAFSWKDTYIQLLRALQHPFADAKKRENRRQSREVETLRLPDVQKQITNDDLFRRLQKAVRHRRPRAILLDEAQHIFRLNSTQTLENQLDHLKYFSDEMGCLVVLFGPYELLRLADYSTQIIRRREVKHLSRYIYNADNAEESMKDFAAAVQHFDKDIQSRTDLDLLEEIPFLYQGCVGCIGALREWLFKAYIRAQKSPSKRITRRILNETIMTTRDRIKILADAKKCEKYFAEANDSEAEYFKELGFVDTETNEKPQENAGPPKKRQKPGKRKPHNDPVGTHHLGPKPTHAAA